MKYICGECCHKFNTPAIKKNYESRVERGRRYIPTAICPNCKSRNFLEFTPDLKFSSLDFEYRPTNSVSE